jgi:hypothetical protein
MLKDAVKFIAEGTHNKELRFLCYNGSDQGNLYEILAQAGYKFNIHEFEDAIVQHLFICKDEDEADNIKQFELWFKQL